MQFFNVSMLSLCFLLQFEGVTLEIPHKKFLIKKKIDDVVVLLKNSQNEFFLRLCNRNKRL